MELWNKKPSFLSLISEELPAASSAYIYTLDVWAMALLLTYLIEHGMNVRP